MSPLAWKGLQMYIDSPEARIRIGTYDRCSGARRIPDGTCSACGRCRCHCGTCRWSAVCARSRSDHRVIRWDTGTCCSRCTGPRSCRGSRTWLWRKSVDVHQRELGSGIPLGRAGASQLLTVLAAQAVVSLGALALVLLYALAAIQALILANTCGAHRLYGYF